MPLKSQFKLIISSLIVLLLLPILVYLFAGAEVQQFMRDFSSYFAALLSIVGIYLLLLHYIKHTELRIHEANKQLNRGRSEEHTSELQSRGHLVCRLLL